MKLTTLVAILALASLTFAQSSTNVKGGYRKGSGTYVQPHKRTKSDGNPYNNWSSKGNTNPYTGKKGTKDPYAPKKPKAPRKKTGW